MPEYTIVLRVEGEDRASGPLSKVGGALGNIAQYALGDLLAGGIRTVGRAFGDLTRTAIGAVGQLQMLELPMGGLLTESIMYEETASGSLQQVMDFGSASEIAAGQVSDLIAFVQELALASPFETEQVELVTQIGLQSRLATGFVKDFTRAFLDYAAVHGIASSKLAFAAEQFLQLRRIGALTTIDLRQLRRLGIDVSRIIGIDMSGSVEEATRRFGDLSPAARQVFGGMAVDDLKDFNKLLKESPEMIDAIFQKFVLLSEETTGGAAQRMTTTITGMMSTVRDAVTIGARQLFRPIVEAVSPAMAEVLASITGFVTGGQLAEIGAQVGEMAAGVVEWLQVKVPLAIETARGYWVDVLQPAIAAVQGFVQEQVLPVLDVLGSWLELALPEAAAIAGSAWLDLLWPALQDVMGFVQNYVLPALEALWVRLQEYVPVAIRALVPIFENLLLPALQGLWAFIKDNLGLVLLALTGFLVTTFGPALIAIAGAFLTAALPVVALGAALMALGLIWREHGEQVKVIVEMLRDVIYYTFTKIADDIKNSLDTAWKHIVWYGDLFVEGFENLKSEIKNILKDIGGFFAKLVTDVGAFMKNIWKHIVWYGDLIVEAFEPVRSILKQVIDKIASFIDWVKRLGRIDLPNWLKPGSPPPLALGLEDIAAGMRAITRVELPRFSAAMGGLGAGATSTTSTVTHYHYSWQPTVNTAARPDEAMRLNYQEMLAMTG